MGAEPVREVRVAMRRGEEAPELAPIPLRRAAYASRHGLLDDPLGRVLRRLTDLGIDDEFTRGEIDRRVRRHQIDGLFRGPFEPPQSCNGSLVLGCDERGRDFSIPTQFANAHSLTVGGSGSGKTNRSRFMALQMARIVPGVWLFDLRKAEFAAIRSVLADEGIDFAILNARDLRFNPLQSPEGVPPLQWAATVADLLVQSLGLPPRATKLLHTTVAAMHQGFFGGRDAEHPTLFDLRERIAGDRGANPQAREAIVDSLDPVLLSLGPLVLGCRRGWTTRDLARRRLIFEFGGVAEAEKDLLLHGLLLSEFTSRVARGLSNAPMDLWVCCDEAQRLLSPHGGRSAIADMIGLVRGTGIGLDLSVQASDILPSVLSNTAIKILGRMGSATDLDVIGSAMALSHEQRTWVLHNLRPGLFVAQLGEGRWRRPFVLRVPEFRAHASGARVGSVDSMRDLAALPVVAAPEFAGWRPTRPAPRGPMRSRPQSSPATVQELTDAEHRYITAVREHPGLSSSEYPKLAKLSTRKAQVVRDGLAARGLLRLHTLQFSPRGRPTIVVEPLGDGEKGAQP